jgi:stage II sporulation protein AA (anti-sigma F factor antagonist)
MVFDFRDRTDEGIIIVELYGELDSSSVAAFNLGFREITVKHGPKKYVLDLKGLEFISSAGWTAFLNEFRQLQASGGDLKLAAMKPDAKRVYALVGINGVIESHETVKEAVKSYAKKS